MWIITESLVIVTLRYLVDETSLKDVATVNSAVINDWIVFASNSHEYAFLRDKSYID